MGLETGTYISDLNASNPASGDAKSQGDDHIRLVKSTIKATFPNVTGAVTPTHTELNYVDGVTSGIQAQLDALDDGPTFSAYLAASGGSVSDSTFTKCLFDTELWDTASNFASSRFTATVAGYYQINAAYQLSAAAPGFLTIYVNGTEYKRGAWVSVADAAQDFAVSGLVKLAVSDYVEIYVRHTQGGALTPQGVAAVTWFDGHFVRSA